MNISNILLHLSLIEKIGPATIDKLVQGFYSFGEKLNNKLDLFSNVYSLGINDLVHYSGININLATRIYNGLKDSKLLENELNLLEKNQIRFVTVLDGNYPSLLKEIYLPPSLLYIKSKDQNFNFINNSIAVVGARKCDNYGIRVVNNIVPNLVKMGYDIISGGAYGIDAVAHKSCFIDEYNIGKTIAVLGSGLLNLYPRENIRLFEQILLSGGALISPFSLNTPPKAGNFPARNRIIAGLSLICLVIQATEKSGALITANYALNQGREVCAVPGQIDNELSKGCHSLISQGANLITSAQDIFNLLGQDFNLNNNIKNISKSLSFDIDSEIKIKQNLSENYVKILSFCTEPVSFDELIISTNLSFDELQDALFDLQVKGYIAQNFMGLWHKL